MGAFSWKTDRPASDINAGVEPPNAPPRDALLAFIQSFPYWYQRIYLGQGMYTMPPGGFHERVWSHAKAAFPEELRDASVLDVGSNAGYFCLQAKLRGAARVVGVEMWADYLRQAEYIRKLWNLDITYLEMDAHAVGSLQESFDLVLFTGILYHLKNPLQVLEDVGRVCRDAIVLETEIILEDPRNAVVVRWGGAGHGQAGLQHRGIMKFVERGELGDDATNWWIPDTECVLGMLRTAGFQHFSRPIYLTENRLLLMASKQAESRLDLKKLR